MITVDSGQQAVLDASVRGATLLIDLEFATGTLYVCTYSVPIVANGHTYTALGNVLSVGPFRESEVLSTDKMTLKLGIVDTAMLAAAMGPASVYRNRAIRMYVQLINDKWVAVEAPMLRWVGIMDKIKINRSTSTEGGSSGSIELVCQRAGLSRFRNATGLRLTDAQQQLEYPGDLGLEYTDDLLTNSPPWLTKRFQQQ